MMMMMMSDDMKNVEGVNLYNIPNLYILQRNPSIFDLSSSNFKTRQLFYIKRKEKKSCECIIPDKIIIRQLRIRYILSLGPSLEIH